MPVSPNRWEVITPSQHEWEQEALDFIRQHGPDTILHAWSNFEFTSPQGAIYEVDLLLLTTGGLYLIEIKSRPGRIEGDATNWAWGGRIVDNPLILANRKAKVLKGLIERQLDRSRNITTPWVSELVFLSNSDTHPTLPPDVMQKVYQREQLIAALSPSGTLITRERHPVDRRSEVALVKAVKDAGVRPSRKALQAGDYILEKLIDEGPGYQDFTAHHVSLQKVVRRIRQFSVARASSPGERAMVLRAAKRDFILLEGVNHPGILRPVDFTENDYGAALIFEYDPDALRLDKWLTQHKDVDAKTRTAIWRQIADALRYAHSRKILHRALSPLSVLVYPNLDVKLMNWHTGARQEGTTGTVHVEELVESRAAVYLAPESLKAPDQATPAADIFSLGCIGFFLFSGRPPAPDFLQLQALLRQYQGLRLAASVNGADSDVDEIVEQCTHPDPTERLTLEDFFDFLPVVEEKFSPKVEADPLNASRLAAVIMAEYPDLWPETVRALIVHSARWTPAMQQSLDGTNLKREKLMLLRRYGYGVPRMDYALRSARDSLTLISQSTIRPFESGKLREMHMHSLPWPREALLALGEQPVRLRITLSYFVDPNPGTRGWRRRYSYASHGLRFDVKAPHESNPAFLKRLNKKALDENEMRPRTGETAQWYLGEHARNRGSLHSDFWENETGADLASRGMIGVYPVTGWWKEQPRRDHSEDGIRYSLVASIETSAQGVDLWTPVATQVGIPAAEVALEGW